MVDISLDFKPVFTGRTYTNKETEVEFTLESLNKASHVLYCEVENVCPSDFEYLQQVKNVKAVKITEATKLEKFGELCQKLNPDKKHEELLIELSYYPDMSWNLINYVKKQSVEATWLVNPLVPDVGKKGPRGWDPVKYGFMREFALEQEIIGGISSEVSAKAFGEESSSVLPLDQHQATRLLTFMPANVFISNVEV